MAEGVVGDTVTLKVPTHLGYREIVALSVEQLFVHEALAPRAGWVVSHWRGLGLLIDIPTRGLAVAAALALHDLPIDWTADAPEVNRRILATRGTVTEEQAHQIGDMSGGRFAGGSDSEANAHIAVSRGTGPVPPGACCG